MCTTDLFSDVLFINDFTSVNYKVYFVKYTLHCTVYFVHCIVKCICTVYILHTYIVLCKGIFLYCTLYYMYKLCIVHYTM